MLRLLPPMLVLVVAWALWSGHSEPLIVGFGALSCLGVSRISQRMDRVVGAEPLDYPLALRSLAYIPWLAIEIVKANLNVASLILNPGTKVHSHLIRVNPSPPGHPRAPRGIKFPISKPAAGGAEAERRE